MMRWPLYKGPSERVAQKAAFFCRANSILILLRLKKTREILINILTKLLLLLLLQFMNFIYRIYRLFENRAVHWAAAAVERASIFKGPVDSPITHAVFK